ncbi:hypothetical protein CICLE_v10018325mg [Citrus x clementina]|uniref:Cytochrome P450 n=1 Tax=Citrus clementina TaxID=85681 RepID=V4THF8_CITCL|nr:hypothetical protein CICLE_v10018325mg [Citrus x clementina]
MVDLQDVLQRFTFNNPCTLVLGLDTNYLSVEFPEVANAYANSITQQVTYNHKAASQADILPSGHHINQNGRILISYYAMGRIEDIWSKDCLEFKPERWISKKVRLVHFAAIHAGPRNCLGKDSAFIQMKTIAVAVLWN